MSQTGCISPTCGQAVRELLVPPEGMTMAVEGESMFPTYASGERVRVVPVRLPLTAGRCYVYILDRALMVHRLIRADDTTCLFIGDNTLVPQAVANASIIGTLEKEDRGGFATVARMMNRVAPAVEHIVPGAWRIRISVLRVLRTFIRGRRQ